MADNNSHTAYPFLGKIDSPADLRKLPLGDLPGVCSDIRGFLINSLAQNPGHFASSMGAVEITVALHYVFNTPYDRIVWDVGHQAYGHKLLTGRRERFSTNRKFGGLSGFPNPDESEYDTFSAGHASNSISAALGMAVASQMNNDSPRRNIVAVIGDASIGGGLAFEGINNAANTPNNLLIILNDNDMSIDANVGSLHRYLARITSSKGYNTLRFKAFRLLKRMHIVTDRGKGIIMRFNNSLKSLISRQQNIFEGLNVRYFGPVDGHDVGLLVRTLNDIKDMTGPRILHIKTVKGKGYAPAEEDPATWHAPGKFDPATGKRPVPPAGKKKLKFQDVFGETLLNLARADRRVVGITAAMPTGTSANILGDTMPERMFDVGISEEHAVTFAGGLAKEGLRPFVAIYSSFLQRSYDQIINDIALQRLPVTFCIDRAGLVGEDGATHHGVFDMAYLRAIPGMVLAAPRDYRALRNLMYTALLHEDGPFAIRYPRGSSNLPDISNPLESVEIGRGEKLRDGSDAVIISIGTSAEDAAKAVYILEGEGISTAHYDLGFIKPLDTDMLRSIGRSGMPIVTVEDGAVNGGAGSAITDFFRSEGIGAEITCLGIPDNFIAQGTVAELKAYCGINTDAIAIIVREMIARSKRKTVTA